MKIITTKEIIFLVRTNKSTVAFVVISVIFMKFYCSLIFRCRYFIVDFNGYMESSTVVRTQSNRFPWQYRSLSK